MIKEQIFISEKFNNFFIVKFMRRYKLFFSYCVGGGMGAVVNLSLLYGLTEYVGIHYLISEAIAFFCATIVNYLYNKRFTFKNKSRQIAKQFFIFVIICFGGACLNLLILYILVHYFNLWYMLAEVIAIFSVLFYNFSGHRMITFRYWV
ncbi:GtrA family protein [Patescibacteria group bacterium]